MYFRISERFCNFAPNLTHYYICMKQTRLADKLYMLRVERRISSRELAKVIGVEPPMYSRIEHGSRSVRYDHLQKIADYYKMEASELQTLWVADKLEDVAQGVSYEVLETAFKMVADNAQ